MATREFLFRMVYPEVMEAMPAKATTETTSWVAPAGLVPATTAEAKAVTALTPVGGPATPVIRRASVVPVGEAREAPDYFLRGLHRSPVATGWVVAVVRPERAVAMIRKVSPAGGRPLLL